MKHLRMLRNALYENYSPPRIRNLKISAKLVMGVLLVITVLWFYFSLILYTQLKDNIHNISSSMERMNALADI